LVGQVLQVIENTSKPSLLLGMIVELDYTTELGDDARQLLVDGLKLSESEEEEPGEGKLAVFRRPASSIGLRLNFPAFEVEQAENAGDDLPAVEPTEAQSVESREEKSADWQATLTIMSIEGMPKCVSVEVRGDWGTPTEWKEGVSDLGNRFSAVQNLLRVKTIEFLKHFRSQL
jgi:hypothetical protein